MKIAGRIFLFLLVLIAPALVVVLLTIAREQTDSDDDSAADALLAQLPASCDTPLSVLVFSKTAGWRHDSIEAGVRALQSIGERRGWSVMHTEDAAIFTVDDLAQYRVVVFLNTTGDVLDAEQERAFENYIRAGGGFVGIHAAADTEYDWAWYGGLVGAYFESHPPGMQEAVLRIEDPAHPAARLLPVPWMRTDEWYNFRSNPRPNVQVILSLDEASYEGGTMGDHPAAWAHEYDGGRAFYTALGHDAAHFDEPLMRAHLAGAIEWAACGSPRR